MREPGKLVFAALVAVGIAVPWVAAQPLASAARAATDRPATVVVLKSCTFGTLAAAAAGSGTVAFGCSGVITFPRALTVSGPRDLTISGSGQHVMFWAATNLLAMKGNQLFIVNGGLTLTDLTLSGAGQFGKNGPQDMRC